MLYYPVKQLLLIAAIQDILNIVVLATTTTTTTIVIPTSSTNKNNNNNNNNKIFGHQMAFSIFPTANENVEDDELKKAKGDSNVGIGVSIGINKGNGDSDGGGRDNGEEVAEAITSRLYDTIHYTNTTTTTTTATIGRMENTNDSNNNNNFEYKLRNYLNQRQLINNTQTNGNNNDNDNNYNDNYDYIEPILNDHHHDHSHNHNNDYRPMLVMPKEQNDYNFMPPSPQSAPSPPSTTITFTNVITSNSDSQSNIDTVIIYNDSTPPYAAVDDHYVPSKPLNLTVLDVTATSITMSWLPPKNQNGAIAGYHVFHIHENQTGVEIVKRNAADTLIRFELSKLKPFTEYRIIVKAFTTKNEGEPSEQIVQRTDVGGPSAPIIVNLTCHSQDSLIVRWKRPLDFYNNIDLYIIKTKIIGQDVHRDIRINASAKELETAMIIQNLTVFQLYEVKVAAGTFSIINPKKIILGKFSESKKIGLQPNCEKLQPLLRQSHSDYNLAVLVGIIFSCFGIVLIVMAFFLWSRKCFHAAYYYLDDPPHHPNIPPIDWEVPIEVGGEIRAAVPINEFAKHVASLHADGDIGFSREYEAIQNECVTDDLPCEHSQHPENKRKNRYLNITAYDHSRVHLHPTPGQKKNLDYINANFIDGYQKSRAFIGTQGPLPDTFDCFWRMIWEQRVAIIVMITNLVERGRRKCDMYWPKDGFETYGVIQVKLIEEEVMAMYIVRTFQIKHLKLKKKKQASTEKIVYQYHYTNWPDHGTPDHPLPVLNFVKKSSAANPPDAGPIVVHCSAGVGRTGTYIVLDAMLKQIQHKGVVNVFGFLRHIRIQRNFLVQTEEQYIFIHDALVEAIASSETNLRAEQIEELKNCTPYLEQQYRNIIQFQTKDIHIASAMKQVNSIKNRGAIFPIECSRVHLTPKPGEEGSDYINASWLHGFRRLRDFIATQHPMAHTVKDFWQMVWDHNAQTIVLLSSLDEINFAQFWPDDSTPIESNYYRVRFLSKMNKSDYVSRDFVMQSIQDDYELNVKMLHCPSWPDISNPNSIYDFIVDVHDRSNDYRNGPIVVVDRYGGAQACTFCAISSLAIEMEYCQVANIYQYAKLYHNKRPGVWTSSEDIRLIYNILALLPSNLQLLKRTAIKTEIEDVTTATPDLYSKICNNGNNETQQQEQNQHHPQQQQQELNQQPHIQKRNSCCIQNSNHVELDLTIPSPNPPLPSPSQSPSLPIIESSQVQATSPLPSPLAQHETRLAIMQQQLQHEHEQQQAPTSHHHYHKYHHNHQQQQQTSENELPNQYPLLSQPSLPSSTLLQHPTNNNIACPPNSATIPPTTTIKSSSSTSSLQLSSTTTTVTTANDCKQQQQQTQVVIQYINDTKTLLTTTTTATITTTTNSMPTAITTATHSTLSLLSPNTLTVTCNNNIYSSPTPTQFNTNNLIINDHITNNAIFHNSSNNIIHTTTTTNNMVNGMYTTTTMTTITTTTTTTAIDPLSIFSTHVSPSPSLNNRMTKLNCFGKQQQQQQSQQLLQTSINMPHNIHSDITYLDNEYSIYTTTPSTLSVSTIPADYNTINYINNIALNNATLHNNINTVMPPIGDNAIYNFITNASTLNAHDTCNLNITSNYTNVNNTITTTTNTAMATTTIPSTMLMQHNCNNYGTTNTSSQTAIHTNNNNNNINNDNNIFYTSNNNASPNNAETVVDAQSLDIVG